jgi:hypothetical protein
MNPTKKFRPLNIKKQESSKTLKNGSVLPHTQTLSTSLSLKQHEFIGSQDISTIIAYNKIE